MSLDDLYEFDLVPTDPAATIATDRWEAIRHRLLAAQPAKSASLVGTPPTAIHVVGYGGTEVAAGLLADVERLAGTALRVQGQGA